MTWIKDNKFLVALIGGTLVGIILIYIVGSKGASSYVQAKQEFDTAASEASNFERLALYPRAENRDGKSKALDDYRAAIKELQAAFEPFRTAEIPNISPQEFTDRLKSVNDQVRQAFAESKTTVPEAFFSGFEDYKTTLARGNATGLLEYQLGGIKDLMLALAKSGASELKNLYRPALPEEQGNPFQPQPADVARPLPLEITFTGSEKSVRDFLSAITKLEGRFVVIRSLRIANAKKEPPRAADAKFEAPAAAAAAGAAPAVTDIFGGAFVLPGDDAAAAGDKPAAAGDKPAAPTAPTPPPAPADSSRILAQVLGNEEVQVFLRLDLLQFLPAKPLP
jgi:hypothetical protein